MDAALRPTLELIRLLPAIFSGLYVVVHLRHVWRLARQTFRSVPVPYSMCLAQTNEWYRNALRQQEDKLTKMGIPWESIKRSFRIHRLDWSFFDGKKLSNEPEKWLAMARRIDNHFSAFADRVDVQPIYHVFLVSPAPLALALGALAGRRVPYVVYQHAGSVRDPYAEVCNMADVTSEDGYHLLNQRIPDPTLVHVDLQPNTEVEINVGDSVLMVWDFTGHKLPQPYPECDPAVVVSLSLKGSEGHIPLSLNWMNLAREISSVAFKYLDKGAIVHVLPGVPSALAFIIGSIIGTTNSLYVYYYNKTKNSYHETFSLHQLH